MKKDVPRTAVIDGAERYIAYLSDNGKWGEVAYTCDACGEDQVDYEDPYWYICEDDYRAPLCYECVRGDEPDREPDPRFIWYLDPRARPKKTVEAPSPTPPEGDLACACGHPLWAPASRQRGICEKCFLAGVPA